jgi:hypothetical protein
MNEEYNSIKKLVELVNNNPPWLGRKINITDLQDVNDMLNYILANISLNEKICNQVIEIFQNNFPSFYNDIKSHYKSDFGEDVNKFPKDKKEYAAGRGITNLLEFANSQDGIKLLSSALSPAQEAIDFFNDPSIAKPALTASKSSLLSLAAPTTTAPVKDKYGLINKLVTGTPASELAAETQVTDTLINAAAGDTSHDFDDKKAISGITNLINTTYKDFYFNGLPGVTNLRNIQSEEQTIASVIEANSYKFIRGTVGGEGATFGTNVNGASFNGVPYSPLTAMKFIKDGMVDGNIATNNDRTGKPIVQPDKCTHEFKTVTGNDYTCTYFDVKPEKTGGKKGEIIDAKQFFLNMGFKDEDEFNIGLIVDCVSITLEDIFNKGTPLSSEKKVRLIKSSEGENDPGGKTNINDKTFKTFSAGKGIDYKAAIPLNIDKNKKYTYYYEPQQKTPYAWFLTNYRFSLSELQYSCKYLFSNLSTTLTITGDTGITPKVIPNSGEANEISQASIVIRNILEKIKAKIKGVTPAQNMFDFNCPFQQKRSGDWLQALICALVAIGERQFCEFNPDIASIFKKKDLTTETHGKAALNFDEVYLVTHDRILLAFALLLGINVIFTHHYKAATKTYSYHSALVYKQKNPFEQLEAMNRVCQNFIEKITKPYVDGAATGSTGYVDKAGPNDGYIYKLIDMIKKLKRVKDKLSYQELYFKTKLDIAIGNPNDQVPINKDAITTTTQNIFKEAFKLVMFNSSLPIDGNEGSIDKFIIEIDTLIAKFKQFLELAGCTVNINNTNTAAAKACFTKPATFYQAKGANEQPYFTLTDRKIITYDTILLLMGDFERIINQGTAIYNKLNEDVISTRPTITVTGVGTRDDPIDETNIEANIYGDARTTSIKAFEKEIGKNTTFLLISGWYPATPKYNLWVQYTNVLPPEVGLTSAVINDKNVFLYNLVTLDDEFKNKICQKYIGIYDVLSPGNPADMRAQAYESIMTFCFEVFINLGFRDTDEGKNRDLKTRIDNFITKTDKSGKRILKDKTDEMNALSAKETIPLTVSPPTAAAATAAADPVLTFTMADIIVIPGAAGAVEGVAGAAYDPVKSSDVVPTILSTIEKKTEYAILLPSIDSYGKFPEGEKENAEDTAATDVYDKLIKFTPTEGEAETEMNTGVNIGSAEAEATRLFKEAVKTAADAKSIDVNEALKSADKGEEGFIDEIMTGGGGTNMVGGRKDTAYNINIDGFYNREPPTIIQLVKFFTNTGLITLLISNTVDTSKLYDLIQTVISVKLLKEDFAIANKLRGPTKEEKEKYDDIIIKYYEIIDNIINANFTDKNEMNDVYLNVYSFLDSWRCPNCTNINENTSVDCDTCKYWRCPTCTNINDGLSDECDTCEYKKPKQGGGSNRIQKGGTNIEEIKQKIENQSILMNEIFGSHPYKPIYFTLYSYCRELDVTDIEQSWDYEQFIQFFVIMNEMVEKMAVNLNTPDKNENMNAVVSGYGLRELIFTSHQYIERDDICKTALKITNDDYYNSLSKMFSILVNRICGTVNQPMEEVLENNKYIENPIFTAYIQQIPFQDILDSNITDGIDVYELKNQANKLLLTIGECIITDTNGISSNNNYANLKVLTDGARAKYLLPNDLVSDIASGLVGAETVNKLGNTLGNAIGDISKDYKNFTDAVTSEPAKPVEEETDSKGTPIPNYGDNQSQIMNAMGFIKPSNQVYGIRAGIGGNTKKRRFMKVPKITRNKKIRKRKQTRKQTRKPRRKQTRRTNKRTRKHRN